MSALQIIIGLVVAMGSAITLLCMMVGESGKALQDIEDYEEDEPV